MESPTDLNGSLSEDVLPLVFFFGSISANDNIDLYRHLVSRLAAVLDQRSQVLYHTHLLRSVLPKGPHNCPHVYGRRFPIALVCWIATISRAMSCVPAMEQCLWAGPFPIAISGFCVPAVIVATRLNGLKVLTLFFSFFFTSL